MQMETLDRDVEGRRPARGGARPQSGHAARSDFAHTQSSKVRRNTQTKTKRKRQQQQQDGDNKKLLNYGSEDDSDMEDDGDNEDGRWPMFLPRAERDIFYNDAEMSSAGGPELSARGPELEASAASQSLPNVGSKNLFFWRDFPNPPVLMSVRREVFSQNQCGPTATVPYSSPYDAFTAIWTREFMEYIVTETNRYAQQAVAKMREDGSLGPNKRTNWYDTNVNELFVFFGLLLGTGLCVKVELEEYWSTKDGLATPYFKQYMSMDRFVMLSRFLHFNNNENDLENMTRPQAKLFKIAPVVEHLNRQFQSLYTLSRNIALDESLIQWKGHDINKFIKNKGATSGIKLYEVCESLTGYLWRFKVHDTREKETASEVMTEDDIVALVLELLRGLEYKGYTVLMDYYYNSPVLARVLKSLGFDCVGTLRTNRQYLPPQLANLDKSDMEVGQIYGCTSGDVDVMIWRDKNRMGFISTYHGVCVHTDSDGVSRPMAVRDYNLGMSGVDKKDQMLSAYPIEKECSQIWYKKLFKRLLNTSILNAFILYKHSSSETRGRVSKHREFRRILLTEILEQNFQPTIVARPRSHSNPSGLTLEMFDHLPLEYGLVTDRGRGREKSRRACVVCHKRISTYCPVCNVTLCLSPCYKSYHARSFNLYL